MLMGYLFVKKKNSYLDRIIENIFTQIFGHIQNVKINKHKNLYNPIHIFHPPAMNLKYDFSFFTV